uniref:TATA-box-binding protein n=1 Tax=Ananas comosus var. bracteatus TaxID=296719 RepID=A0A6V7QET3_ANACO|nr:unnamed protein product [Ananas comosus var. bracteatus]
MISAYSQNGLGEEALGLYSEMHRTGIVPTPYVLSSVLSGCTKAELFDQGKLIHAQVFKRGFSAETFVGNALVTLYSRCGSLRLAEQIFEDMPCHDKVTFNSLISGHVQYGDNGCALKIFEEMRLSGLKPDSVTIASLLTACASIGGVQKGKQLHSFVFKTGLSSDYIIEGSLLDLYVKCADMDAADELFGMSNRENVVLWNVMLVAYGQMGDLIKSFGLFHQMQVEGMRANQYTYPSVLRTCTYFGELALGEQVHGLTIKMGFELNVYVSSVLIDMYSKCGKLEKAREILERQTEKDVVSWTAMIAGYAQKELCVEALHTFGDMQAHGIRPDNIGLASAISACAGIKAIKQGLQVHAQACVSGYSADISIGNSLINLYAKCGMIEEALSAFEILTLKDEISWNGLISGFAQSGLCEEALRVFVKMDRAGVKSNLFTFGSAVSASANIADIKQGKQIHARVIKTGYGSEIEAGNALVSLYAKCGSIEDANSAEPEDFAGLIKSKLVVAAIIVANSAGQESRAISAPLNSDDISTFTDRINLKARSHTIACPLIHTILRHEQSPFLKPSPFNRSFGPFPARISRFRAADRIANLRSLQRFVEFGAEVRREEKKDLIFIFEEFGEIACGGIWEGKQMADQGLEGSQPVDLSKHPSGIVPTLQNIVSTVNLDCKLDLKAIALQARNAEYNPKRFAAVIMRIREPKTTALIFASGKMVSRPLYGHSFCILILSSYDVVTVNLSVQVCTGAKSEQQSKLAARKYARIIQKLGFPAKFKDFKIQNIVGSCDVKFPIRLEGLAYSHGAFSSYEPELFPGLIYRMKQPKIVLLIFVSGKIVLTGAKVRDETYAAFENIYPVLTEFRKTQQG